MAHLRWLMLISQAALLQLGSQKKKNASFWLKGRPSLGPVPATAFWQSVALTATRRRARPPGVGDFSPLPRPKGSCSSKPRVKAGGGCAPAGSPYKATGRRHCRCCALEAFHSNTQLSRHPPGPSHRPAGGPVRTCVLDRGRGRPAAWSTLSLRPRQGLGSPVLLVRTTTCGIFTYLCEVKRKKKK